MAKSYVLYNGTGGSQNLTVPFGYISQSHVLVLVDGASVPFSWVNDTTVQATTTAGTSNVRVKRVTPRTPLVTFSDSSGLTMRDLNTQGAQARYIAEEQEDAYLDGTLTDLSVDTPKIADAAVTVNKLGANSVSTAKIQDSAVTTAKINDLAVTTAKINDSAVTSAKLGAASVSVSKLASDTLDAITNFKDTRPTLIRAHFGEYQGVWVQDGEAGGELTFTVTSPALAGATSLSLSSTTGLMVGQLCVYKGTDGQYRSIELTAVAANSVSFAAPGLAVGVAAGVNFANYYVNFAHPSEWGFRSLSDFAIREMRGDYCKAAKIVFQIRGYNDVQRLLPLVGGTLVNATSILPTQPGGGANNGVQVNTAASGDGCYFTFLPASSASHILSMNVNPGGTGNMVITITASDGTTLATKTVTANGNHTQVVNLSFKPIDSDIVKVAITKLAADFFIFGNLTIAEMGDHSIENLNYGTHVLFGDSWATMLHGWNYLQTALPNATFINGGVGGERTDQILARFDTAVAPYTPDFVWVFAGTNDYFQAVTVAQYRANMAQIIAKIQGIGAKAIVFEPSVGVKTYAGKADKELTSLSRDYNQALNVLPMVSSPDSNESNFGPGTSKVLTITIPATSLTAGGYEDNIIALVGAGKTVELLHSFGIGLTASLYVKLGFTTGIGGAIADGVTITSPSEINTIRSYTNNAGANRFVVIRRENTTGAPAQFGAILVLRVRK